MVKVRYDFHIHSCLSPCAADEMTPATIVGFAALAGLDMIAVADHNSIQNVAAAMEAGKYYNVIVVPGMELQTAEDIHVLCLFRSFDKLEAFYNSIEFTELSNRKDIFGNQFIVDIEDNIIAEYPKYLLSASSVSADTITGYISGFGGAAIPAHIDRPYNGMVGILGDVPDDFRVVEFSANAEDSQIDEYSKRFKVIFNSDAHIPTEIMKRNSLMLSERSIDGLFEFLEGAK